MFTNESTCSDEKRALLYQKILNRDLEFSLEYLCSQNKECYLCQKKSFSSIATTVSSKIEDLYAAAFINNAIENLPSPVLFP